MLQCKGKSPVYGNQTEIGGIIMAFFINDDCVSCGTCAAGCPSDAIDMGDDKYVIDQDKCVSCGACKESCPVEAIEEK